jgi:hypothetical protein
LGKNWTITFKIVQLFFKKLCQKKGGYGVNYLITQNLDNRFYPSKFLEDYDIQNWNAHIYQLLDEKYQKKSFLNWKFLSFDNKYVFLRTYLGFMVIYKGL